MLFLKKIILAITAFVLILWGGASTQTNSLMLQGGGFVGLIVGIIILFIFGRMAWRAIGCLPALIVLFGIICFILYAIGGFRGGIENLGKNLKSFLGQKGEAGTQIFDENFAEEIGLNGEEVKENLANLINTMSEEEQAPNEEQAPSNNLPKVYSKARVISADTIQINGGRLQLYGIDAPEMNQSCANSQGRSYRCGQEAANWLKSWIGNYTLSCQVMGQAANGNYVGICSLGDYDIGAALVNAGWAVANREESEIYIPYEQAARQGRNGLWGGRFYMPWDWRKQMSGN